MRIERQDELKKAVFKLLYYKGALSLADLSHYTRKSIPNVTSIIGVLLQEGYAVEDGLAPSTGGRRALRYSLNKKAKKYVLAVAMDQFTCRIVLYNLLNAPVHPELNCPLPLQDAPHAFDQLCMAIERYLVKANVKRSQIKGIGIGMPGFIDVEKGINSSFLVDASEPSLRVRLANRLELPVYLENDSSAIAIAELHFGAARGVKDAMVVNMGWGIGLGMIVSGKLFRGHNGYAGEFSHIPLSQTNRLCSCGKRGCLEVDASLLVAIENAKQALQRGTTSSLQQLFHDQTKTEGEWLIDAAKKGDQLAVSSLSDAALIMGKGIATLIHIMNPARVIISGRGSTAGNLLLAPVHRAINEYCIPKLAQNTNVVVSSLGDDAQLLGAASLVIEHCRLGEHDNAPPNHATALAVSN